MSISGIYAIEFGSGALYIGRSTNIKFRYLSHIRLLNKGEHYNNKMQKHYFNDCNTVLHIIEECSSHLHISKEIFWIKEFSNESSLLNLTSGGDGGGIGYNNSNSIYSKTEIEELFMYMVNNPNLSLKTISDETKVSYGVVQNISKGLSHSWLKDIFPSDYEFLTGLKGTRAANSQIHKNNITYPQVISPKGVLYEVINARKFAIENDLDPANFRKVLIGQAKQHKGWKILKVT